MRSHLNQNGADAVARIYTEIVMIAATSLRASIANIMSGVVVVTATAGSVVSIAPAGAQVIVDEVYVTARRREESAQDVPIPITVVTGDLVADTGAFNVNRLQQLVPSMQFYSTNPRNTSVNIRGFGLPFGLTNDGIESGVGFYVDGVLYARPASTTLDFVDIERVEVLRGPQGTLFGKNTTAGAVLVTTRKPSFEAGVNFELSYGDDNYTQAKASVTGPLGDKIAGRLSFAGTQRDGNIYNTVTQEYINDLNNSGLRGQLLFEASDETDLTFTIDYTRQRPEGYAQVLAGVAPTYRGTPGFTSSIYNTAPNPSANPLRHFWGIINQLGYTPPNVDTATREVRPYDRVIDTLTPWRSGNEFGGVSVNLDTEIAGGTLTATTAWRYWVWDPSNDRDYLRLDVGTLSQAPSKHEQVTQEVRWSGDLSDKLSGVFGFFAFDQKLNTDPVHTEQVGDDYFWFVWNPSPAPNGGPNLSQWGPGGSVVDNYFSGQRSEITSQLDTVSVALFAQIDWQVTDRLHIIPGLRYNYDDKEVDWAQLAVNVPAVPVGSPTPPAAVYTSSTAVRQDKDKNTSGQLTFSFDANDRVNYYATYATAFKSIGINLGGGAAIEIPPEDVSHVELGLKTRPTNNSTLNATLFNTVVEDFQTQVLVPGNARPVIASAEEVRSRGAELDLSLQLGTALSLHGGFAYTDAEYTSFANAPVPLELTGYTQGGLPVVDATGGPLPGVSKWTGSFGGEYHNGGQLLRLPGEYFAGFDIYYRDGFSSSATPSEFLNVDAYSLTNLRAGFRADNGFSGFVWIRNAFDEEYIEMLQAAPAGQGVGHYGAQLGDPRTYGVTFRYQF
jgi:iron complex outermembrane recepter protein